MGNLVKRLPLVLIGFFGILAAVPAASKASCIFFVETGYNFGELSEMTPLSHDFIVKNTGKATLNIRDVKPS